LYLICSAGFKQNSYDFFGREVERVILNALATAALPADICAFGDYFGIVFRRSRSTLNICEGGTRWTRTREKKQLCPQITRINANDFWSGFFRVYSCDSRASFYGAAKPISIGAFGFCVFTIAALAGCTSTRFYLISSTRFKENS